MSAIRTRAARRARSLAAAALASGAVLAATAALGTAPAIAAVARAHTTLPAIERQVMCVTCKIPLNVAESPQADRERAFIALLISRGENEAQIKRALVGQYGSTVLGLPSTHGFDATVYIVPVAVLLAVLALLAVLLPRWRRRGRAGEGAARRGPPLAAADAARLEADLERFDQ
jgi:cytochrome c-type biogenesis protein CcmH/NrfF